MIEEEILTKKKKKKKENDNLKNVSIPKGIVIDKIDLETLLLKSKLGFFILLIALLFLNSNLMNSGCLVYPVDFTCFPELTWAIPINEVQELSRWYEQWAKPGAGPNISVENPEHYNQGFNWVPFWFQEYFFNKVSDTLAGIIFIIVIFYCLSIFFIILKHV